MHNDARLAAKVLGSGADAQTATQAHPITDTSREVFVACFSHYYSLLTPPDENRMHAYAGCLSYVQTQRRLFVSRLRVWWWTHRLHVVVVMMRGESKVHQDA